jgi:hypothetical protein
MATGTISQGLQFATPRPATPTSLSSEALKMTPDMFRIGEEVRLWLDPDGGITLSAATREGDPVELTSGDARRLAAALGALADEEDAD